MALRNALTRRDLLTSCSRLREFNLAGYVINSLNQARTEGHGIAPSRQVCDATRSDHQKLQDQKNHAEKIRRQCQLLKKGD